MRLAREAYLLDEEIHDDLVVCDQLLGWSAQVNNGGFDQYVFNRGWDASRFERMHDALLQMGTDGHASVLKRWEVAMGGCKPEESLTPEQSARCEAFDEEFYVLQEDLWEAVGTWFTKRPGLQLMPWSVVERMVADAAAGIPDVEERQRAEELGMPFPLRLLEYLGEESRLKTGQPGFYNGPRGPGWYTSAKSWLPWKRAQWLTVDVTGDVARLVDAETGRTHAATRLSPVQGKLATAG